MNDRPPIINIDVPKQPRPVINIDVPKQSMPKPTIHLSPVINVPQQEPPVVNVEAYARPKSWVFDVEYNSDGRIETVTARPQF